jgi:hypothetical protein
VRIDSRPATSLVACAFAVAACTASTPTASPVAVAARTAAASPTPAATPAPTPSPTPSPTPTRSPGPRTFTVTDPFPVTLDLTLGEGWSGYGAFADGVLFSHRNFSPPGLVLFGVWQIDTLFADPCAHTPAPRVGKGVDALVKAIRAIPGLHAGKPSMETVGGLPATQLDLTFPNEPAPATCAGGQVWMWGFAGEVTRYIPGGYKDVVERLWIVDADGTRVVFSGGLSEGTDADVEALDAIIRSIRFR